jgi:hypothetical protein
MKQLVQVDDDHEFLLAVMIATRVDTGVFSSRGHSLNASNQQRGANA